MALDCPLNYLLLGHWNTFFNGFASSQLFYKTLKDLRILSWISYCLQEDTFPPDCLIFLFSYFCLFLHILSYSVICSCFLPMCFTAYRLFPSSPFLTLFLLFASVILILGFFCMFFPCLHVSYLWNSLTTSL